MLVDTIDDKVGGPYSGMPSRLYLIDRKGKVAYKSGRGPFGFKPADVLADPFAPGRRGEQDTPSPVRFYGQTRSSRECPRTANPVARLNDHRLDARDWLVGGKAE